MMKRVIACLCFFAFLAIIDGKAQYVRPTFGLKGFGVATMMETTPKPDGPLGMYFSGGGGAFVGVRVGRFLGLQGELLYAVQGGKYEFENDATINLQQHYFYIPLVAQFYASNNFILEFGYQFNKLSKATLEEKGEYNTTSITDEGALTYGTWLAGMTINMGKVVYLNARYTFGSANSYVMYGEPFKTSTIQLGLGFRFYTKKRSVF